MSLRLVVDNTKARPIVLPGYEIDHALDRRIQVSRYIVVGVSWFALIWGFASVLAQALS